MPLTEETKLLDIFPDSTLKSDTSMKKKASILLKLKLPKSYRDFGKHVI